MQHNKENNDHVKPIDPVAPWLGGKSRLADTLVQWINAVPHSCYAEPFVGMGGVFFRRNRRPHAEVINDYSRDVANLFRIVQRHFVPFVDMMRWTITTRAEFERLSKTDPDTLTDLEGFKSGGVAAYYVVFIGF